MNEIDFTLEAVQKHLDLLRMAYKTGNKTTDHLDNFNETSRALVDLFDKPQRIL